MLHRILRLYRSQAHLLLRTNEISLFILQGWQENLTENLSLRSPLSGKRVHGTSSVGPGCAGVEVIVLEDDKRASPKGCRSLDLKRMGQHWHKMAGCDVALAMNKAGTVWNDDRLPYTVNNL